IKWIAPPQVLTGIGIPLGKGSGLYHSVRIEGEAGRAGGRDERRQIAGLIAESDGLAEQAKEIAGDGVLVILVRIVRPQKLGGREEFVIVAAPLGGRRDAGPLA